MRPKLYICYGMPKSGSTLAFQLSRVIARQAGHKPNKRGEYIDERGERTSACRDWSEPMLDQILAEAEKSRRMLVIKTHTPPSEAVMRRVAEGAVRVQAVCRDPRDIALSMVDMGRSGGSWGRIGRGKVVRAPSDVRERIAGQIETFKTWASIPGALILNYERVAFDTKGTSERIADHMGFRVWPWLTAYRIRKEATHFNKGKPMRHQSEMKPSEAADWQAEFGAFIRTFCHDVPPGCAGRTR